MHANLLTWGCSCSAVLCIDLPSISPFYTLANLYQRLIILNEEVTCHMLVQVFNCTGQKTPAARSPPLGRRGQRPRPSPPSTSLPPLLSYPLPCRCRRGPSGTCAGLQDGGDGASPVDGAVSGAAERSAATPSTMAAAVVVRV
jgi:hypothetical protein